MDNYDHLVHVDEAKRELVVYRLGSDGQRHLYTSVPLPSAGDGDVAFATFARELGENVLLDSPAARRLLRL